MVVFQSARKSFWECILSNPHPYLTCSSSFLRAAPSESLASCRRFSAHLFLSFACWALLNGEPTYQWMGFLYKFAPFAQLELIQSISSLQNPKDMSMVRCAFFSFSLKFQTHLANTMFAVSAPYLMCKNAKVLPEVWVRPSFVVMPQAGLQGSGQVLLSTWV